MRRPVRGVLIVVAAEKSKGASRRKVPTGPGASSPSWIGGATRPTSPSAMRPTSPTWKRIYDVVRRIPRGKVATYGQVSALAGFPHAPRLAGYALHALPDGTPVPWHRVVAAGGRLSLARLSASSALTQRMRLEREGVGFDPRGRVRLERYGWKTKRK